MCKKYLIPRDENTEHFTDEQMMTLTVEGLLRSIKFRSLDIDGTDPIPRECLECMLIDVSDMASGALDILEQMDLPRGELNFDFDKA